MSYPYTFLFLVLCLPWHLELHLTFTCILESTCLYSSRQKGLCDVIRQSLVFLFTTASSVLSCGLSGQILSVVVL